MRLVIVTGLSGAGKSVAIRQLEDSGYYCVDNLPVPFIEKVALDLKQHGYQRVAMAIDARSRMNLEELRNHLEALQKAGRELFTTDAARGQHWGLGLAAARRTAQTHNGTLTVINGENGGGKVELRDRR